MILFRERPKKEMEVGMIDWKNLQSTGKFRQSVRVS